MAWVALAATALAIAWSRADRWSSDRGRAISATIALATAGVLGFGYAAWRAEIRLDDALPPEWEGEDIALTGIVDELPNVSERGVSFAFAVERVSTAGAIVPGRISLGWHSRGFGAADEPPPEVHAGERWSLVVRLKRPHGTVNPAGFDLEAWLLERNLRASGYVRSPAAGEGHGNVRLDPFAGRPRDYVQRARERVRERIATALADAPHAGVIAALAIGDQRSIPPTQWTVFNRTGIAHLISISGLHVTVFATLAGAIAYALARRSVGLTTRVPARKVAAAIGLSAAAAYTLLAGAEVPALRTLLMLAIAAAGMWLGRPGTARVVWLWALALVLVWDPWAVLAPGFWLSYGAVGLLLYGGSGRLGPPPRTTRRDRLLRALREGARTQWIVTLGLVPFTLALFQQVSLVSPLANAVAIPVVTLAVVPLTLAGVVIPFDVLFELAHAVFTPLMAGLAWLAGNAGAVWAQHAPVPWTVVTALAGVIWILAPRGVPGRALGVCWLLPLFVVAPAPPPPGAFRMTVLDVGQGLAVVVRTHAHALLYDTGPRWHETADAGGRVVAPYLRVVGIARLSGLVVSHQDLDHAGGASSVLQAVPVDWIASSLDDAHPIAEQVRGITPHIRCIQGQAWEWDGVRFEMLHPTPDLYTMPRVKTNDRSCVVRIESAHGSALLSGDIEARSEADLVRRAPGALASDVLVVPHHGSRTSSTPAFVRSVAPAIAIFTAGYRNRFGHPRPDVVARYEAIGAELARSDFDGAVTLEIEPGPIKALRREREHLRRYWFDQPRAAAGGIE